MFVNKEGVVKKMDKVEQMIDDCKLEDCYNPMYKNDRDRDKDCHPGLGKIQENLQDVIIRVIVHKK